MSLLVSVALASGLGVGGRRGTVRMKFIVKFVLVIDF